jgi:alpha/beta superfamily hydrolase
MQVPVQIDAEGRAVLGMLHVPPERASGAPLILLNYGLNGDRVDNHRLAVLLARRANAAGVSVLRFDTSGSGVSAGEFHDTSIGTKVADTMAMIDFIKGCFQGEPLRLFLLGYSDGIRVVHHVLKRRRDVSAVAAWNPIIRSMAQTFRSLARNKMAIEPTTRKLVFPLFGVYLGVDYLREANEHLELAELLDNDVPKLFVFGTGDVHTLGFQQELRSLRRERSDFELQEIEGANHLFNRVAWSEELVAKTVDWVLRA